MNLSFKNSGVDWEALHDAAARAMARAYVPYSKFPVGAAALTEDGRIVSGCNVENASYGLTLCAECSLVSQLQMTGGGRLVAFSCVDGQGNTLMPCGRCRQLLYEFRAPGMQLMTLAGVKTMDEVLPDAFGPEHLAAPNPASKRGTPDPGTPKAAAPEPEPDLEAGPEPEAGQ